jgi:flagellin-specific chaperone FliS
MKTVATVLQREIIEFKKQNTLAIEAKQQVCNDILSKIRDIASNLSDDLDVRPGSQVGESLRLTCDGALLALE